MRAADAQLAVLSGHTAGVNSAAYSPDGRRIVTASDDKTARIWDAATGAQLAVLSGHNDVVDSAAYSPDGRRIVTASDDKTARIWDAATGAQLAVLSGHGDAVDSAAYSPDGRRIVTASYDKTARIWDAATGAQLAVLSGHGDARHLRRLLARRQAHRHRVAGQDRAHLGCRHGRPARRAVRAWRSRHLRRLLARRQAHRHRVVRQDRAHLGCSNGRPARRAVGPWPMPSTPPPIRLTAGASSPRRATRPRGSGMRTRALSSPCCLGTAIVVALRRLLARRQAHRHRVVRQDRAHLGRGSTSAQLAVLSGHGDGVSSAAYSPDGTRIVTASCDKTARIWDAATGAQLDRAVRAYRCRRLRRPTRPTAGASSPRPTTRPRASGMPPRAPSSPCCLVIPMPSSPPPTRPTASASSRRRATRPRASGMQPRAPSSPCSRDIAIEVRSAAYSPDGRRIVTASCDKTARIWDAATGTQFAVLSGHSVPSFRCLLTRRQAHRHRVVRQDRAHLGCGHGHRARRAVGAMVDRLTPPPTHPTASASSPRRPTRPRASGMQPTGAQLALLPGHSAIVDVRRLLARRQAHRHRVERQDRAHLGRAGSCRSGRTDHVG